MTVALIFCGALLLMLEPAKAHEWFEHRINPVTHVSCCDGVHCNRVEPENWWQSGSEYVVRGKDRFTYSIPINQAEPSQDRDGYAIACIWGFKLKCFFLPMSG